MLYQLRKDCYIRTYGEYGYIVSAINFNDLVVDENGKNFLSVLTRTPQSIDDLALKILNEYNQIDLNIIKKDAMNFFDMLVDYGFVVKGNNETEVLNNNCGFNYKDIVDMSVTAEIPTKKRSTNCETQDMLDKYFVKHPFLTKFQIELTSRCNERCIHCYIPHEYKNNDIEEELYYSVLDQLEEIGTLELVLSGGEPMAHPKFKQFLIDAKKRDFQIHVLSNLTLLDNEIIDILKQGNKVSVQTSVYSMNPQIHDAITSVEGSLNKTLESINKLIANDIPLQISCPIMKTNLGEYTEVAKFANKNHIRINCDYSIMAEYNHDTQNLVNRITPDESRIVIKEIILNDIDYKNRISEKDFINNVTKLNDNGNEIFCGVGLNSCCMVSNGNVYPCAGWQSYVCGNLYHDSLKNVWSLSKELNYLRSLRKKDINECNMCKDKGFCHPCLARFANESKSGNPLEVAKHFCEIAKVNREEVEKWRLEHINSNRKED